MKTGVTISLTLVLVLFGSTARVSAQDGNSRVTVIHETAHATTPPLHDMLFNYQHPTPGFHREIETEQIEEAERKLHYVSPTGPDTVRQQIVLPTVATTDVMNFDGLQNPDDVTPPDTNGAVGATQFVQWVNLSYAIYNKTTGALEGGPYEGNTLWQSLGQNNNCAVDNAGDIIAKYDTQASRWVLAQPVFNYFPYMYCVAVSTTSDATGSWNVYSFQTGTIPNSGGQQYFPDYPKLAIWPSTTNPGYFASFNAFCGANYCGPVACALDRTAMLAGESATMQCSTIENSQYQTTLLPAEAWGATAPTGPEYFMDISVNYPKVNNKLNLWEFNVNWSNPNLSTFKPAQAIGVSSFQELCGGDNPCVLQPKFPSSSPLFSQGDRLMQPLVWRKLNGAEHLLALHTIGSSNGCERWYDITPLAKTPINQSGTFCDPANVATYWMGAIGMDKSGDIALGFSATSTTTLDPSVMYTGRVPTDPLGTMESTKTIISGSTYQSQDDRWGDYSGISIDPADDCTFWYTQEYYSSKNSTGYNNASRIASFKFTSCN